MAYVRSAAGVDEPRSPACTMPIVVDARHAVLMAHLFASLNKGCASTSSSSSESSTRGVETRTPTYTSEDEPLPSWMPTDSPKVTSLECMYCEQQLTIDSPEDLQRVLCICGWCATSDDYAYDDYGKAVMHDDHAGDPAYDDDAEDPTHDAEDPAHDAEDPTYDAEDPTYGDFTEAPPHCENCMVYAKVCGRISFGLENIEPGSAAWWKKRNELLLRELLDELQMSRQEYLHHERRARGEISGEQLWEHRWRVLQNLKRQADE